MKIFVTGASGFVGGAATRRFVNDGHEVLAMSRSATSDNAVMKMGATPVRCDLDSVASVHLDGCDIVLHCAAFVGVWGPKDAWYRTNVGGTGLLLAAARGAGVRRFIHIGTEAAIVHGQHIRGADESYPLALDSPYPYCATKAEAEKIVRTANTADFETIVLRPRLIWGPGDTTFLPLIEKLDAEGGFKWIDHGKIMTSSTHIENLVSAIVLSLDHGIPGEAYFILDDGNHSLHYMLSSMAASKGITLQDKSIPSWLAYIVAIPAEILWRYLPLKGEPPLTRHAVTLMCRDCVLDDRKARRELQYAPVISVEDGFARLAS